ncbi:MAG TPA: glycosyl transferase, partial [Pseudomonadota bacterium]|nr:glycosyl transferase [Pseudomonadota bacterium]
FGLAGWQAGWWPPWFPVLVFLPFIADATLTLGHRLLRRTRIWEPHREHFYQRLVLIGRGHAQTLAAYALLMLGSASSALAALAWAPGAGMVVLLLWAAILALVFAVIAYHWRRRGVRCEESKG